MKELPFNEEFVHPYAEDVYRTILDSPEINDIIVEQNWLNDNCLQSLVQTYCFDEETQQTLLKYMDRQVNFRLFFY